MRTRLRAAAWRYSGGPSVVPSSCDFGSSGPSEPASGVPSAMRAASYAAELGAGGGVGPAASRLAFCGGFDLEDPEILAEAAATARIPTAPCLAAADNPTLDQTLETSSRHQRLTR